MDAANTEVGEFSSGDKYSGRNLSEVLKSSSEENQSQGKTDVLTVMPGVRNGRMTVEFSPVGKKISFGATGLEGEQLKRKLGINEDPDIKININQSDNVELEFNRRVLDVPYELSEMGLSQLLKNVDAPKDPRDALRRGYIKIADGTEGGRKIPVKFAPDKNILNTISKEGSVDGKVRVFHGTSYEAGVNIAELGLFGRNFEDDNLTLSERVDGEVWEALVRNGQEMGAVVVLDCLPDEVTAPEKGFAGVDENVYGVSKDYLGSGHNLGSKYSKQIPPERVSELILVVFGKK